MFTQDSLKIANENIKTIPIRGKQYAQVPERVKAFRKICPAGLISTEIVSMENGVVTMKSTIYDEKGTPIATGYAQEKEGATNINKTSYVENCETSAIGRALGFAGIGSECSMASAEEVANAIVQQNYITEKEQRTLVALCERKGLKPEEVFPLGLNLTGEQYAQAVEKLGKRPDKK